jgi:hypothetical protein
LPDRDFHVQNHTEKKIVLAKLKRKTLEYDNFIENEEFNLVHNESYICIHHEQVGGELKRPLTHVGTLNHGCTTCVNANSEKHLLQFLVCSMHIAVIITWCLSGGT